MTWKIFEKISIFFVILRWCFFDIFDICTFFRKKRCRKFRKWRLPPIYKYTFTTKQGGAPGLGCNKILKVSQKLMLKPISLAHGLPKNRSTKVFGKNRFWAPPREQWIFGYFRLARVSKKSPKSRIFNSVKTKSFGMFWLLSSCSTPLKIGV